MHINALQSILFFPTNRLKFKTIFGVKYEICLYILILNLMTITKDAYIGQRFTKRSSYLCGIYDKTANTMKEPFQIPTSEDIENLIGTDLYDVWNSLCQRIEKSY